MDYRYYCASLKDNDRIMKSSSGGVAYAMCEYVINHQGIAYGVEYMPDFTGAQYIRVDKKEKIEKICGSKYITTNKQLKGKNLYENIFDDLLSGGYVLFIGLPCEVSALYKYLDRHDHKNLEKLLTVDLVCQGPLDSEIQTQYIRFLEKKYKSSIIDFSVRFKNPNWTPIYLKALFENGKQHIKPLYETDFGRAFLIYGQEYCYVCENKGDNHKADLTLGDFWGMTPKDEEYNIKGVSVVITHNEKGDNLFRSLESITWNEITKEKAIGSNVMYSVPRKKHPKFEDFKEQYALSGLHKAVFKVRSFSGKIKYFILYFAGKRPY